MENSPPKYELLSDKAQNLLEFYLYQNIIHPVTIDSEQLAYRWVGGKAGRLEPITANLSINLADLHGIDSQKAKIIENTEQFLAGFPANHVLMTGTRGSGKSSLVRALLNKYHKNGLRIIEVARDDLLILDKIREAIRDLRLLGITNCHYIIYCDDLAFDKQDENYRTLKSILDGSLDSEQENLLVYATSNRRHLLPQMMKDNVSIYDGQTDEINPYEAIDETVSLSDRFGLWLSFHPMEQETYLDIAKAYIKSYDMEWNTKTQDRALQWASTRGGRSGRVAYQFSRHYVGQQKLLAQGGLEPKKEEPPQLIKGKLREKLPSIANEKLDKLLLKMAEKEQAKTNKNGKKQPVERQIGEFTSTQVIIIISVSMLIVVLLFSLLFFANVDENQDKNNNNKPNLEQIQQG
ncbi:MAG: ATP-binding protein [Moraxellaceae bacterium]|nr:ATP-binding protein [Moraxellaceae bacterium]